MNTTNNSNATAFIHPEAKIGKDVVIGPFTYIDKGVEVGDGTWIGPSATLFEGARIGKNCRIFPGVVIAGIPQDLKFKGEMTTAEVGDNTTIREYVTINRGTSYANKTAVGSNCLLMAYAHVAHDCILGDHVILANNVNLAGHVEVGDWAILEGLVAVQQFIKIGQHSFIAGGSLVRKHVPPYVKAAREPLSYAGVNSIGLRRRQFKTETINEIQEIYRILFVKGYSTSHALEIIEDSLEPTQERDSILNFIKSADPGIMRGFQQLNGKNLDED
ncbi:acyl-ACP--UDP-N-acetylglucosamine O-acyltransferase [Phaeodactylibacter luteus]|uniref:Acyl-ACP--UDP-N-acetylglucosamine O-acyltransferase n=1 Tax=Phaeodactylibacter luteus TaxID=1564516 RepID=A0A5C6RM59_9BACT|nr:acyl-ACP--UDP-N-acetylglucosamine O-acyltransferase [Phaeodactylibacter luteus]TXB63045.1 acyl-ACP--UDP-N-acetylglucosamine O-acyltransferase [Phaeodactylibacter luteus]